MGYLIMSESVQSQHVEVILNDDDIIEQNQQLRKKFVKHLTPEGKFPEDIKAQYVLLTTMADMDRTALQNKKIGSTERQGAADRQAAMLIATIVGNCEGKNPFESTTRQGTVPQLQSNLIPEVVIVPGETDIGLEHETYDQFTARMESKMESK